MRWLASIGVLSLALSCLGPAAGIVDGQRARLSAAPSAPAEADDPSAGPKVSKEGLAAAPTDYDGPHFEDVAEAVSAAVPGYGTGVAWGDYDGDGDEDLYVVGLGAAGAGEANVLLRNDCGKFTDVTRAAGVGDAGPGVGAAWAAVDNAGDLDLFVANRPGANKLYVNERGRFSDLAVEANVADPRGMGEGVAWADVDRDGRVDLYVANYSGAPAPNNEPNRLFHNLGNLQFRNVAGAWGVADRGNGEGVAWADYDRDGDLDLFVANARGPDAFYRQVGLGRFTEAAAGLGLAGGSGSSFGAAWGDYDNDGWLDLYVTRQGPNRLYHNLAGTGFEEVAQQAGVAGNGWSMGCAWGDFDNDGDLDLHVANADQPGYEPDDALYENVGGAPPTFRDVTEAAGVTNRLDARGSAWADYDGDGDLDLYVVNQGTGQPNRLWRNGGLAGRHWLAVRLVGRLSNRLAMGARVTVRSEKAQVREISGGSGFASQDSLPVEFGLRTWSGPVEVTVQWPSGVRSVHRGVAIDQTIGLFEPQPSILLPAVARDGAD